MSQEFFLTLTRAEGGNIKQFTFTKDGKMSAVDADLMVVLAESTDDKARSRFRFVLKNRVGSNSQPAPQFCLRGVPAVIGALEHEHDAVHLGSCARRAHDVDNDAL